MSVPIQCMACLNAGAAYNYLFGTLYTARDRLVSWTCPSASALHRPFVQTPMKTVIPSEIRCMLAIIA
jgi:hypothetical protein